jgi:hypothetical protein
MTRPLLALPFVVACLGCQDKDPTQTTETGAMTASGDTPDTGPPDNTATDDTVDTVDPTTAGATGSSTTGAVDPTTAGETGPALTTTSDTAVTTSDTAVTTSDDSGFTGGSSLSCADYCETIAANCSGSDGQYFEGVDDGMTACMTACAAFPAGAAADQFGNTLGCRSYHAGAAGQDPAVHCEHAGPGGAGVCGTDCDGFCAIALEVCAAVYADEAACLSECAQFTDDVAYNTTVIAGDSLACRLYHLTAAAVDPATHCPHITANSPPCM